MSALEKIWLGVVTTNEPALNLHKKMGFVVYGTDAHAIKVDSKDYDEYLMVKYLKNEKTS